MSLPAPIQESFATMLTTVDRGRFNDALTDEVRELVQQLHQLGQGNGKPKGEITLKLKMAYDKGAIFLAFEHSTKRPKTAPVGSMLFPDEYGRLWKSDPRQGEIFREPSAASAPTDVRQPAPSTGPVAEPSPRPTIALAQ